MFLVVDLHVNVLRAGVILNHGISELHWSETITQPAECNPVQSDHVYPERDCPDGWRNLQ